jgi:hypothetical protein
LSQHLSSLRICDLQLSSQVMHMLARAGNVSPSSITSPPLFCSPTANAKPAHALQQSQDAPSVAAWQADLNVRVYQLNSEGAADETEGDVTSCQIWMLPATVLMCSKHAFVPVGSSCVQMCLLCCSGHHALRTCVFGRNFTGFGTL